MSNNMKRTSSELYTDRHSLVQVFSMAAMQVKPAIEYLLNTETRVWKHLEQADMCTMLHKTVWCSGLSNAIKARFCERTLRRLVEGLSNVVEIRQFMASYRKLEGHDVIKDIQTRAVVWMKDSMSELTSSLVCTEADIAFLCDMENSPFGRVFTDMKLASITRDSRGQPIRQKRARPAVESAEPIAKRARCTEDVAAVQQPEIVMVPTRLDDKPLVTMYTPTVPLDKRTDVPNVPLAVNTPLTSWTRSHKCPILFETLMKARAEDPADSDDESSLEDDESVLLPGKLDGFMGNGELILSDDIDVMAKAMATFRADEYDAFWPTVF